MTTDNNSKSAPWDQEAEQATLGAMLVEAGATKRAFSIVETEDFYSSTISANLQCYAGCL